jgi:Ca2+-binding RTX toxin-like protein
VSIITVGTTAALQSALSSAHAGDTIRLQAGQYDGLAIKNLSFSQDVTITSADPLHQAVLTNFGINHVTGLTISNVQMFANNPLGAYGFSVLNSDNIHFDHVGLHGSLDGNAANDQNGLLFQNSSNVSLTNSELQQLAHGVMVSTSSNVQLTGNAVHDMRVDGFDFAQVDHVTVTRNSFTSFHSVAGDHADAIQFWTTNTTAPSHDIMISDNVVTMGSGTGSQGIFLRDTNGSLAFQNVTISGNLIDGGNDPNGIRVIYANGLTVSGNTLVTQINQPQISLEVDNSDNVTSSNNQAVSIRLVNDTHVTQSGDALNNVMSDNGNTVLANWLHAHGLDALYSALSSPVSQTAMATLGAPNLATVATTTQPTLLTVQMMDAAATSFKLGGGGDFTVIGNDLNDSITGNSGANLIYGGAGNDTIDGGGGADTLNGGAGDDVYFVPNSQAVVIEAPNGGNDTVVAKGDYTLPANVENLIINPTATNSWAGTGNELNNVITGNSGANVLDGKAGNDTIDGGAGNDTIIGGAGDDRLTGGTGNDTFRFGPQSGHDVITDFGAGGTKDVIDISAYKAAGLTPTVHDIGSDVVISFSTGDSITVLGVHAHDLVANNVGWVF